MSDSIKQLQNLKSKLTNQKLSALIGAGFSLNVSDMFPTWWQLLYDMVLEMYRGNIESSWEQYFYRKNLKRQERVKGNS